MAYSLIYRFQLRLPSLKRWHVMWYLKNRHYRVVKPAKFINVFFNLFDTIFILGHEWIIARVRKGSSSIMIHNFYILHKKSYLTKRKIKAITISDQRGIMIPFCSSIKTILSTVVRKLVISSSKTFILYRLVFFADVWGTCKFSYSWISYSSIFAR